MRTKESLIHGRITFSRNKVLLKQGEKEYYIKPFSLDRGYVEGDLIEVKIVRMANEGYLSEVIVKRLVSRSNIAILGSIEKIGFGKISIHIFREYGNIGSIVAKDSGTPGYIIGDIVEVIYFKDTEWKIRERVGNIEDPHIDEMLLYRKESVRIDFPEEVIEEAEHIHRNIIGSRGSQTLIPKYLTDELLQEYFDPGVKQYFPSLSSGEHSRTDFRHIFTMTIDGADAKDLDDAISIARYEGGDYLLAVHIADVSEYVREGSALDQEALKRTTSIYTPGKVIPMLPEKLSNDLCSLHPGEPKLTLSIMMKIDMDGQVLATYITEGIIESDKRGIYEEIVEGDMSILHLGVNEKQGNSGSLNNIPHLDDFFTLFHILEKRRQKEGKIIFESSEPIFTLDQEGNVTHIEKRGRGASHLMIEEFMVLANEEVAKWCAKRQLPFLSRIHHFPPQENLKIIQAIIGHTASREDIAPGDIRKFLDQYSQKNVGISEFRVENSSSECRNVSSERRDGRVVGKNDSMDSIDEKLGNGGSGVETVGTKMKGENGGAGLGGVSFSTLETFDTFGHKSIEKKGALYRLSRLLLPKMAKAFYSDTALMHFGLALEFYSHFTSPIRRYPDLQIHRIIKEELRGELTTERKKHYRSLLKKIAKQCSDGENLATSIERAVDAIMICRYMEKRITQSFSGRVSGLAEWAIFVELESGIEVTVYTEKGRSHGGYIVDPVHGTLSRGQKILHTIGDELVVKVIGINTEEKRVEGEIIEN